MSIATALVPVARTRDQRLHGCGRGRRRAMLNPSFELRSAQELTVATRLSRPTMSAPAPPPDPRTSPRSRWRALVDAAAAVRSTDPARVESALTEFGGRRRWL